MTRLDDQLSAERVIPVLTPTDEDAAEHACRAILAGGLGCVEITFRTTAALEAIRRATSIEGLLVGAGTVLTSEQASLAAQAGAQFLVAPGLNEDVVRACAQLGVPFIPGTATPSEIDRARALGCSIVKVFPASLLGGVSFLKAMAAVFRDMRFVPTGGIGPSELAEYLAIPSVLACGGSWICDGSLLTSGDFDEIERRAREARSLIV
jgi:2-dehydro-3-deoxyphosphogluconate aldolase/(4S)-4-hydroxy-2-oxoglutarate aldolase